MTEFSARDVTLKVLDHLEQRRPDIAFDGEKIRAEVEAALVPVMTSYREAELPAAYMGALAEEVRRTVPARWQAVARDFTAREKKSFGLWRGGDPVSRLTYVFGGLVVGGFILWAPFIPIWEKWFPFALALAAFFLPDIQTAWHRRRYARALGDIALAMDKTQPRLDAHFQVDELFLPPREGQKETP